MANVTVQHKTGEREKAGTDFDVDIRFNYEDGTHSDWFRLDHPNFDDRERGDVDTYGVETHNPSAIVDCEMRVRHEPAHLNDEELYDAWFLCWMSVTTPSKRLEYDYDGWIKVPPGDASWHSVRLILTRTEAV